MLPYLASAAYSILPSQWCQLLFVGLGLVVLTVHYSPYRRFLLVYGSRALPSESSSLSESGPSKSGSGSKSEAKSEAKSKVSSRQLSMSASRPTLRSSRSTTSKVSSAPSESVVPAASRSPKGPPERSTPTQKDTHSPRPSFPSTVLRVLGARVPHACFTYFYLVLVLASLFWAHQFLTHGPILAWIAQWEASGRHTTHTLPADAPPAHTSSWRHTAFQQTAAVVSRFLTRSRCRFFPVDGGHPDCHPDCQPHTQPTTSYPFPPSTLHGTEIARVQLLWWMVMIQGARRLYESVYLMRPSQAKMLAIHVLGTFIFYLAVSVSVWVEGSAALLDLYTRPPSHPPSTVHDKGAHGPGTGSSRSSRRVFPSLTAPQTAHLLVFLGASALQSYCHAYLMSLVKYTLPSRGLFRVLVCPHYTCECVIYLVWTLAAAPHGHHYSRVFACALFFVVANLMSTAESARAWYEQRFGVESVRNRWVIFPWVY